MSGPLFTILLPVLRPPDLLPIAIDSVLAQTVRDFELCVVCDGAPAETADCARLYAERDPRVKVFVFEKGERHGEAHRHTVLEQSCARYVTHMGDDDLWFPDYLAQSAKLMETADFGNLLQLEVVLFRGLQLREGDLADPATRQKMLDEKWNFFGPSVASYRLSAYRALPVGWAAAPPDVWTDLHMWRKFLRAEGLTFATRFVIEAVKFAADGRQNMSMQERREEILPFAEAFAREEDRADLQEAGFRAGLNRMYEKCDVLKMKGEALRGQRDRLQAELELSRQKLDRLTLGPMRRFLSAPFR